MTQYLKQIPRALFFSKRVHHQTDFIKWQYHVCRLLLGKELSTYMRTYVHIYEELCTKIISELHICIASLICLDWCLAPFGKSSSYIESKLDDWFAFENLTLQVQMALAALKRRKLFPMQYISQHSTYVVPPLFSHSEGYVCLLLFYILAPSKVISGLVPTCDSAHACKLFSRCPTGRAGHQHHDLISHHPVSLSWH